MTPQYYIDKIFDISLERSWHDMIGQCSSVNCLWNSNKILNIKKQINKYKYNICVVAESDSINTHALSQKLSQPYFTTCELKVGKI